MKYIVFLASLVLSITPVAAQDMGAIGSIDLEGEASAAFSDVTGATANAEAIGYVKTKGLVQGYGDGTYRPGQNINRYDFTKILIGANFSEDVIAACDVQAYTFPDVPTDQWFSPYVCVAKMNGIINGYADGTFQGQNQVSLPEALKIILETYDVDTSAHEEPGAQWYAKYVDTAAEAGLLAGIGSDIDYRITRGDMAELIFRQETGGEAETEMSMGNEPTERAQENDEETMDEQQDDAQAEAGMQGEMDASTPLLYLDYSPAYFDQYVGTRPVALFFHADWCPNCQALDALIQENINALPQGAVILKADFDTETELKSEYGITVQTTVVFFDEAGNVVDTITQPTLDQLMAHLSASMESEAEAEMDAQAESESQQQDEAGESDASADSTTQFVYEAYTEQAFNAALGNRPVALFFHADWCPTCQAIDQEIQDSLDTVATNGIVFKVDYDNAQELRAEHGVTMQSTFVFFDAAGKKSAKIADPSIDQIVAQFSQ